MTAKFKHGDRVRFTDRMVKQWSNLREHVGEVVETVNPGDPEAVQVVVVQWDRNSGERVDSGRTGAIHLEREWDA